MRIECHFWTMSVARESLMRCCLNSVILGWLVCVGVAYGDEAASPKAGPSQDAGAANQTAAAPATVSAPKTEEAKLLGAVREALERNAQEIKALKEQYARDMEQQRKKVESQQKQIDTLQQSARVLKDRLKAARPGSRRPREFRPPPGSRTRRVRTGSNGSPRSGSNN